MDKKYFAFVLSFLIYIVCIALLYLTDAYIGFLMNIIFGGMIASVFAISIVTEMIQKSKISKSYFWSLAGLIFASLIGVLLFQYQF